MRKGQLVLVEWSDIRADLCTSGNPEPLVTLSIGRVESCRGKFVRLVNGWYEDEEFPERDTIVIPKGCITKVSVLEVV